MRKRINLSVSDDVYNELVAVQKEYGFHSVCEVAVTLLALFLKRVRKVNEEEPLPEEDEETIREMFEEYGSWEPRPEPGHAPKIRRPRRK